MGLIGTGILLVMSLLMICFRKKILKKLKAIKEKMLFNGVIRSVFLTYMKISISVAFQFKLLLDRNPYMNESDFKVAMAMFAYLLLIPIGSTVFLTRNRDVLDLDETRKKYGNMYIETSLRRAGTFGIYYFPIFFFRRLLFIMTPILVVNREGFQCQILMFMSTFYLIYYQGVRPHLYYVRTRLEFFNEGMILIVGYMFLLFSSYNPNYSIKFSAGYIYVLFIGLTLVVNISVMVWQSVTKKRRLKEYKWKRQRFLKQYVPHKRRSILEKQAIY